MEIDLKDAMLLRQAKRLSEISGLSERQAQAHVFLNIHNEDAEYAAEMMSVTVDRVRTLQEDAEDTLEPNGRIQAILEMIDDPFEEVRPRFCARCDQEMGRPYVTSTSRIICGRCVVELDLEPMEGN